MNTQPTKLIPGSLAEWLQDGEAHTITADYGDGYFAIKKSEGKSFPAHVSDLRPVDYPAREDEVRTIAGGGTLLLEDGKRYWTREEREAGCGEGYLVGQRAHSSRLAFPFKAEAGEVWAEEGFYHADHTQDYMDLVCLAPSQEAESAPAAVEETTDAPSHGGFEILLTEGGKWAGRAAEKLTTALARYDARKAMERKTAELAANATGYPQPFPRQAADENQPGREAAEKVPAEQLADATSQHEKAPDGIAKSVQNTLAEEKVSAKDGECVCRSSELDKRGLRFYCTLEEGHEGDHIAHIPGGEVVHTWPKRAEEGNSEVEDSLTAASRHEWEKAHFTAELEAGRKAGKWKRGKCVETGYFWGGKYRCTLPEDHIGGHRALLPLSQEPELPPFRDFLAKLQEAVNEEPAEENQGAGSDSQKDVIEKKCGEHSCICNCKDSIIQWVDSKRPHPAIEREGWFCTSCLAEFQPVKAGENKTESESTEKDRNPLPFTGGTDGTLSESAEAKPEEGTKQENKPEASQQKSDEAPPEQPVFPLR